MSHDHKAPIALSVPIVAQHIRLLPGEYTVQPSRSSGPGVGDALVSVEVEGEHTSVALARGGESGWVALYTGGTAHDLDTPGMTVSLIAPLSAAGLPIFVASTSTADVVLVPGDRIDAAVAALTEAGHTVAR